MVQDDHRCLHFLPFLSEIYDISLKPKLMWCLVFLFHSYPSFIFMIVIFNDLQQEIADASNDVAKKYYEETEEAERTVPRVTAVMKVATKAKQQSFKVQSSKFTTIEIQSLVIGSSKRSVVFPFNIRIFLSHLLWRPDHCIHPLLQITKHWSNYEKLEMSLERL